MSQSQSIVRRVRPGVEPLDSRELPSSILTSLRPMTFTTHTAQQVNVRPAANRVETFNHMKQAGNGVFSDGFNPDDLRSLPVLNAVVEQAVKTVSAILNAL